jgi:hypothetical protein
VTPRTASSNAARLIVSGAFGHVAVAVAVKGHVNVNAQKGRERDWASGCVIGTRTT